MPAFPSPAESFAAGKRVAVFAENVGPLPTNYLELVAPLVALAHAADESHRTGTDEREAEYTLSDALAKASELGISR